MKALREIFLLAAFLGSTVITTNFLSAVFEDAPISTGVIFGAVTGLFCMIWYADLYLSASILPTENDDDL